MLTIETIDGIEIKVTPQGKFTANVNGREVTRTSITPIKRMIMALRGAVVAQHVQMWGGGVRKEVRVIGFEAKKARTDKGELIRGYETILACTPEEAAEFDGLIERQRALKKEWDALVGKCLALTHRNFDEVKSKAVQAGNAKS